MTVAEYLTPVLRELLSQLRANIARVHDEADDEALHDLRVVLRRLRSLLKPVRKIYGRFHADSVRGALRQVAQATGLFRDEEVLEETLAQLALDPAAASARDAWLSVRKRRLRELREALLRLVRSPQMERSLEMLAALLTLPVDPVRDRDVSMFALRVVRAARDEVVRSRDVTTDNVEGLHRLRILYKRLRYAIEGFEAILPPKVAAGARTAARFQKRLGEVHDIDVAISTIEVDEHLGEGPREQLLSALRGAREQSLERYRQERIADAAERAAEAAAEPAPELPASVPAPPSVPPAPMRAVVQADAQKSAPAGKAKAPAKPSATKASATKASATKASGAGPAARASGKVKPPARSPRGRGKAGGGGGEA